jgi:hypothetical protein
MTFISEKEKKLIGDIQETINEDKILNKLQRDVDVYGLLDFNELTIGEKLIKNPVYSKMFRLRTIQENSKLEKLKDALKERESALYDKYKFHDDRGLTKTEIERYYLNMDEKVKQYKKAILTQSIVVQYYEAIVEAFKTQHWSIKHWLEKNQGGF